VLPERGARCPGCEGLVESAAQNLVQNIAKPRAAVVEVVIIGVGPTTGACHPGHVRIERLLQRHDLVLGEGQLLDDDGAIPGAVSLHDPGHRGRIHGILHVGAGEPDEEVLGPEIEPPVVVGEVGTPGERPGVMDPDGVVPEPFPDLATGTDRHQGGNAGRRRSLGGVTCPQKQEGQRGADHHGATSRPAS